MTAAARHIPFPPWTIIVPQLMWLLSFLFLVYFTWLFHDTYYFVATGLNIIIIVGLHLRWRVAFWLSVLGFAVATGGDVAQILAAAAPPLSVVLGALISLGMLVLHQTPTSLRLFGFQKHRAIRFLFWLLSGLACVACELWLIHYLPRPD